MATLPFMPHTDDDKADLLEYVATSLPRYTDLLDYYSPRFGVA